MNKKALVTLALGKRYERMFDAYCRPTWSQYASKHALDLITITSHLDTSARAQSRSPAWQKCLVLAIPQLQAYDQVVYVDADVLINPMSPDITQDVPVELIGAVDDYATPSSEEHHIALDRAYRRWRRNNISYIDNSTPTLFHQNYGLVGEFDSVVQTGVMVLSPRYHRALLEHVYFGYEDKGSAIWSYEMRPLSYEILTNRYEHWISPKFNMVWAMLKELHYPFLSTKTGILRRILRKLKLDPSGRLLRDCIEASLANNHFLHFAGAARDMLAFKPMAIRSHDDSATDFGSARD